MPKLILKKGDFIVKKLYVPEDVVAFTVGSEQGNDIIIKDESISFFHLQFEKQAVDYYVRDLQSQNGTLVNGQRINGRQMLNNQDEVALGNHRITFLYPKSKQHAQPTPAMADERSDFGIEERLASVPSLMQLNSWLNNETDGANLRNHKNGHPNPLPPAPKFNHEPDVETAPKPNSKPLPPELETENRSPGPEPKPRPRPEPEPEPRSISAKTEQTKPAALYAPEPEPKPTFQETQSAPASPSDEAVDITTHYLIGIYGYYTGRKLGIKHPITRIGRDRKLNDIVIKKNSKGELDQSVSRRQATISFRENRYYLKDRRSKSRTWLNQAQLEKDDEYEIQPGDEIEILSDRKSHIFRFVQDGEWDFAFPRKAGAWHVRHRVPLLNAVTAAFLVAALVLFGKSLTARNLAVQQPDPLEVEEVQWFNAGISDNTDELKFTRFPAVTDINGDAYLDLILVDGENRLTCIDGKTNEALWRNEEFEVIPDFPVIVDDLYNDGTPDIVVVSRDSRVRTLEGKWGIEIWKSPILAGPLTGSPVVSDFNNDGLRDVAIGSAENAIFMGFSGLKSPRWLRMDLEQPIRAIMSATDLTGDGIANLLLGTETGQILFIDALNQRIVGRINVNEELNKATGRFDQDNQIRFPVALGDVNGDGIQDLIAGSVQGNLIVFNGANLKRLWYDTLEVEGKTEFGPGYAVGDLDGDQMMDIVLSNHRKLRALKGLGKAKDRKSMLWELPHVTGEEYVGHPVLADFNKNGAMDVLVACNGGKLLIFEGATGVTLWESNGGREDIISAPVIADLDKDNTLDIVTMRHNGAVYKLKTNSKVKQSSVLWGQIFENSRNTNQARFIEYPISQYNRDLSFSAMLILTLVGLQGYFRYKRKKLNGQS